MDKTGTPAAETVRSAAGILGCSISRGIGSWWFQQAGKGATGLLFGLFHFTKGFDQFRFENRAGQGNQILAGDHHDVHAWLPGLLVVTEDFSYFPLGPVAGDGVAYFSRGNDAQPVMPQTVGQIKKSAEILHSLFAALGHDFLELGTAQQPVLFPKGTVLHAFRQSGFCVLCGGDWPAPGVQPPWPSAPGNRGCAFFSDFSVDRFVS